MVKMCIVRRNRIVSRLVICWRACTNKQAVNWVGEQEEKKINEYNNDESCVESHKPKLDEVETETIRNMKFSSYTNYLCW